MSTFAGAGQCLGFRRDREQISALGKNFSADGRCLEGPAGSNSRLIRLPTQVEDGVLNYV